MGKKTGLRAKFGVLIAVLVLASLAINIAFTAYNERVQMENELHEQARALSQQMDAVWQFMSNNQERLEATSFVDENGNYHGLHCAVAGRVIAQLFSNQTDYVTRFVKDSPRNVLDTPDAFETEALISFAADDSQMEFYAVADYEDAEMFRYVAPMYIEENCLQCHGEPAGELDITGYPKEGWKVGDIAGAISIAIPLDVYRQNEQAAVYNDILFFGGLLAACLIIVYLALSYLVTKPLEQIKDGVEGVHTGDFDVQLPASASSREISTLIAEFNEMVKSTADMYNNLELQVVDRTAQLAAVNETLEEQRAMLEEANGRLRDENQYKSDFLAVVSHELRTPLTSIIAFAELLNKDGAPRDEKEAEARREIESNSRSLLLLINDILEVSRLDAGRIEMNWEVVDLGDVLEIVCSLLRPIAEQRGIEFACHIDPDVPLLTGDFEKIKRILENLCSNALKFTDSEKESWVHLDVSYHPECAQVWLKVSDNGIGIAKKDQARIFERFVQADASVSRTYGGTGLGLALVREYTGMHRGSLSVESEPGKGSTFTVHLPAEDIEQGSDPEPEQMHDGSM